MKHGERVSFCKWYADFDCQDSICREDRECQHPEYGPLGPLDEQRGAVNQQGCSRSEASVATERTDRPSAQSNGDEER